MKTEMLLPSYIRLLAPGELRRRAEEAREALSPCRVCPHECAIDRFTKTGFCKTPATPLISSFTPHFGEEPVISGTRGSGTVFLGGCNLRCVFCQNHQISQPGTNPLPNLAPTADCLSEIFLKLQARGCHNINWVSPSHQIPQLLEALSIAVEKGLRLPIVYNSNAYDSLEMLRLLENIVDIYLPDLKYADEETALRCSGIRAYPEGARAAIREMFRQLGSAWDVDDEGCLRRGLLIRMLVLPNRLADIEAGVEWIASELSREVTVSLMAQYHPDHLAISPEAYPLLSRTLSPGEWARALESVEKHLQNPGNFIQDYLMAPAYYRPDFSKSKKPFAEIEDFQPQPLDIGPRSTDD